MSTINGTRATLSWILFKKVAWQQRCLFWYAVTRDSNINTSFYFCQYQDHGAPIFPPNKCNNFVKHKGKLFTLEMKRKGKESSLAVMSPRLLCLNRESLTRHWVDLMGKLFQLILASAILEKKPACPILVPLRFFLSSFIVEESLALNIFRFIFFNLLCDDL